jgi:hypothetical protein
MVAKGKFIEVLLYEFLEVGIYYGGIVPSLTKIRYFSLGLN